MYCSVISILVIIGFSLRYIYKIPEYYFLVTRIYNVIEYALLSYFFSLYIKNTVIKRVLVFSAIPFTIFAIFDFVVAKVPALPFTPLIVEFILLLIFIIYFFFEVMQETVVEPVYQRAIFWISVAFIINFSGNFFLFLYSKNSFTNEAFQRQYTLIYSTVTILKNVLLCIGIATKEKKISNSFSSSELNEFDSFAPFKNLNR